MGLGDAGWSGDASVADLNGDGFPDLYVLNMQGDNHYYENEGGKRFVDRTAGGTSRGPPGARWGSSSSTTTTTAGRTCFVTDMHSDMSEIVRPEREKLKVAMRWTDDFLQGDARQFIFGNAFYHNLGDGKFEEISDRVGVENYWPWGPSVGDLNADGWQDVFIASRMNYPFRYGINSLLLNNRGEKFLDSEFILGVEPRARRPHAHALVRGRLLATPTWRKPRGSARDSTGKVTVMATARHAARRSSSTSTRTATSTSSPTSSTPQPQVLVSDLAAAPRRPLAQGRADRDGVEPQRPRRRGARVGRRPRRSRSGTTASPATSRRASLPLYFGLGDAATVDRVEVDWPSGRTQVVTTGLTPNATLRLTEPARPQPR